MFSQSPMKTSNWSSGDSDLSEVDLVEFCLHSLGFGLDSLKFVLDSLEFGSNSAELRLGRLVGTADATGGFGDLETTSVESSVVCLVAAIFIAVIYSKIMVNFHHPILYFN